MVAKIEPKLVRFLLFFSGGIYEYVLVGFFGTRPITAWDRPYITGDSLDCKDEEIFGSLLPECLAWFGSDWRNWGR